jgi:hypothetical protein
VERADLLHALRAEVYELLLLHALRLSIRGDALQGVEGFLEVFELETAKGGAIVAVQDVWIDFDRMVEPLSCIALLVQARVDAGKVVHTREMVGVASDTL